MYKNFSKFITKQKDRDKMSLEDKIAKFEVSAQIRKAFLEKSIISGKILGRIQGGYRVKIFNHIAFCPESEMYPQYPSDHELNNLKLDNLEFLITTIDMNDVAVSRKAAIQVLEMGRINKASTNKTTVKGYLIGKVKGGYHVTIDNLKAFCPETEMYPQYPSDKELDKLKSKIMDFTVINGDVSEIVVSRKEALQVQGIGIMERNCKKGAVLNGIVEKTLEESAIIDIEGVKGIVHKDNLPPQWIRTFKSILYYGRKVKVKVLSIDKEKNCIYLSVIQ